MARIAPHQRAPRSSLAQSVNPLPAPVPAALDPQLSQFYTQFNPDGEYRRIQHARQRVAQITANVNAQLAQLEAAEGEDAML